MSEWIDVEDITPRIAYTATASQTVFTVPFVFFGNSDLVVYKNSSLLTLDTDYNVTGAEDEDGGTVTLLTGATVGDEIMIVREIVIEQTTHIPPSGPLDVPAINIQISKIIAMLQELAADFLRSLRLADNVSGDELEITTPVAGEFLKWNATADGIESAAVVTPDGSYAIATQSEAIAGTANDALMTPLRAAQIVNVRLAKTADYTVSNADNRKTIALGGTAFYTLTFLVASAYDANFQVMVVNEDTTRAKSIALDSGLTFYLWPGQSVLVFNQNNVWMTHGRSRWKLTGNVTVRVNSSLGLDTNDGLATGAGAFNTAQAALAAVVDNFDNRTGPNASYAVTVLMEANDTVGIHQGFLQIPGSNSGSSITLDGGGFSMQCVDDSDAAIHLFFNSTLLIQNIKIIPGTNHSGLNLDHGCHVRQGAGVIYGPSAAGASGGAQIQLTAGSVLEVDNNYSFYGGAGNHLQVSDGAIFRTPGNPVITCLGSGAFNPFVSASAVASANFLGASFSLGAFTITGARWNASLNAVVISATAAPDTFFPGNAIGNASTGGQGG